MRLFVALDLPAEVRAALAAWADAAAPAIVRRVPPDNLHLTLAFLGSRDEEGAAAVGARLPGLGRPLEPLRTAGALWLSPRRPSVLTVALRAGPDLASLRAEPVAALGQTIGFEPERRPFTPHVTVGRVPRGTRIDTRTALDPPPPELVFDADALTLYRSHTGGTATRYEPLQRVAIG
jgi:RNA 2',3'-cyclic 3'-phosphodiesterase